MKKYIHINQVNIRYNKKNGSNLPVITVKTYKNNFYGDDVIIHGPSRVVYSPNKPLSCGAKVWIVCECPVEILGCRPLDKSSCILDCGLLPKSKVKTLSS